MKNQKGQTVVEALFISSATVSFFVLLSSTIYMGWFYTCLNYISHEYLICQVTSHPSLCDQDFRQSLKKVSLLGNVQIHKVKKTPSFISMSLKIRWQFLTFKVVDIEYHDKIHLPLQTETIRGVLPLFGP